MPRDTQRKKLYAAENAVFRPDGAERPSYVQRVEPHELSSYIRRILTRKTFTSRFGTGVMPVKRKGRSVRFNARVSTRKLGAHASGTNTQVYGASMLWNWVVCHETAHTIHLRLISRGTGYGTGGKYGDRLRGGAWHGREFAFIYLIVVRYMMGKEAHDALKASFKKHKVKFSLPRKASR
jgi:hypothetical protein